MRVDVRASRAASSAIMGILLAKDPSGENAGGQAGVERIKADAGAKHPPFLLADRRDPGITPFDID
jgi:hypothetical protein